jgi:hypothetical protein
MPQDPKKWNLVRAWARICGGDCESMIKHLGSEIGEGPVPARVGSWTELAGVDGGDGGGGERTKSRRGRGWGCGLQVVSEIRGGVFCNITSTSLKSGRREYKILSFFSIMGTFII